MKSKVITLVVVVIAVLGGWYIYRQGNAGLAGTDTQDSQSAAQTSDQSSSVKEFTISGGNYYFSPNAISVNKGDTVKINFVNSGGVHNLIVDGYNVGTPTISSGQDAAFTFVADKSGSFEYYCSVGSHRQMGMKGTLTVN